MIFSTLLSNFYKILIFFSFALLTTLPLMADHKKNDAQPLKLESLAPDVPPFSIQYKGEDLECSPRKLIKKKTHKDMVAYHCVKKIRTTPESTDGEEKEEKRGSEETARFREDVKEKGPAYVVHIPLADANNIRLTRFIAYNQLKNRLYGKIIGSLLPAKLYVSLRPQFASLGDHNGTKFQDGGSRGGFFYYYQFHNDIELMLQYEAGINFNSDTPFINISDGDDSSRRLSYLSLSYSDYSLVAGKYWSAYYDIAGFTDYYMAYGSQTSGAFNDGTDGSASGTGRPDRMLQIRTGRETFKATLQVQSSHDENENIDKSYQYGLGGSVIYKGWENIQAGGAFVYEKFDEITAEMIAMGITGDDQSYIVGGTYKKENFSANAILSYTQNHMDDDQGVYFDGVGAELYLRYDIDNGFRLVCGGNVLIPRDSDYSGEYSIRTPILSLQYTFGEKTFDDLIYMEISKPYGRLANGEVLTSRVAIGLRWLWQH